MHYGFSRLYRVPGSGRVVDESKFGAGACRNLYRSWNDTLLDNFGVFLVFLDHSRLALQVQIAILTVGRRPHLT